MKKNNHKITAEEISYGFCVCQMPSHSFAPIPCQWECLRCASTDVMDLNWRNPSPWSMIRITVFLCECRRLSLWIFHHHSLALSTNVCVCVCEFLLSHFIMYPQNYAQLVHNQHWCAYDAKHEKRMNSKIPIGVIAKSYFIIAKWREIRTQLEKECGYKWRRFSFWRFKWQMTLPQKKPWKLIPYNNNHSAIKRALWHSWRLYFIAFGMIPMCLIVPWPQTHNQTKSHR